MLEALLSIEAAETAAAAKERALLTGDRGEDKRSESESRGRDSPFVHLQDGSR